MSHGYDIFTREGKTLLYVSGKNERELFSHALLGLAAFLRPDVAPTYRKRVKVRAHLHAPTLSLLLQKFLSHVLFENEMHDTVFSAMDIIVLSPEEIECELTGVLVDHTEEHIEDIVLGSKGIERFPDHWEAECILES